MAAEFLPVVTDWFRETYGQPTYPQLHGWQAISEGHHTLIVAPTGSGKTLPPPALRPIRRIEVHTWDGLPVRESEAAGPLRDAGFYGDGPRLLWDGYPGPRPRS